MKITPRPLLCLLFLLPLLSVRAQVVAVQVAEMKRTDFYGNILSCQDSTFTFVTDERDTSALPFPPNPTMTIAALARCAPEIATASLRERAIIL